MTNDQKKLIGLALQHIEGGRLSEAVNALHLVLKGGAETVRIPVPVQCTRLTERAHLVRIETDAQGILVHNLLQAIQSLYNVGFFTSVTMDRREPLGPKPTRSTVDIWEMKP